MCVTLLPTMPVTATTTTMTRDELLQYQQQFEDPQASDATTGHTHQDHVPTQDSAGPMAAAGVDPADTLKPLALNVGGRWSSLRTLPAGTNAYHMIMGPGGKIVLIAGSGNDANVFAAGTFKAYMWSPTQGIQKTLTVPIDMFCAGHMLLSNGKGLAVGGTSGYKPWKGARATYTFDFTSETFVRQTDMQHGRWYPTVIGTPGGDAVITGGYDQNGLNSGYGEFWKTSTNGLSNLPGKRVFPLYPHIFVVHDGRYFFNGAAYNSGINGKAIHPAGFWDPLTNSFTPVSGLQYPHRRSGAASCFIGDARRQHMIVIGGGSPALSNTNTISFGQNPPTFRTSPSLRVTKTYMNCVNLPDESILEVGGGATNQVVNASRSVSQLAVGWKSWKQMNPLPAGQHRLYHSMAFLLDDGRVVSMGSNPSGQPRSDTVLVYEPPYLFRGTRPTIGALPPRITYGQTVRLTVSPGVTKIAMMTSASPTHAMDVNQRAVYFPVVNGQVKIDVSPNKFPRNQVRFFAIDNKGAVSKARWTALY
jgi:hypothetical protein